MAIELSFVTEDAISSGIIKWFTHSDFSHVDIIMADGSRFGARQNGGVQLRLPNYAKFTRDERVIIHCDPVLEQKAYNWLWDQYEKPYDSQGLLRSFLFNQGRSVSWRDDQAWWCSELGMAFTEIAVGKQCVTPASRIAPNDLLIFAGALGEWRKVV